MKKFISGTFILLALVTAFGTVAFAAKSPSPPDRYGPGGGGGDLPWIGDPVVEDEKEEKEIEIEKKDPPDVDFSDLVPNETGKKPDGEDSVPDGTDGLPGGEDRVPDGTDKNYDFKLIKTTPELEAKAKSNMPPEAGLDYDPRTEEVRQLVFKGVIEGEISGDDYPFTVRIMVDGVKPGDRVSVIFYLDDSMTDYIMLEAIAGDGWIDIIIDGRVSLSSVMGIGDSEGGYFLISYVVPVRSPQTGADYTVWYALIGIFSALLFLTFGRAINLAKQK